MPDCSQAAVIGCGIAGMLAATVLSEWVDEVFIIERDRLPDGPVPRKGVPQARHVHQLWSTGARVIEKIFPGTIDELFRAGANRISVPQQQVTLTAFGWQHRFAESQFMVCCSRPLIDWTILRRVRENPRITVLEGHEVVSLLGTAEKVAGVVVRELGTGSQREMPAELTVDAAGRGSQLAKWLAGLGLPPVEEDVIDSGITYATRRFRAPANVSGQFPIVSVYGDHRVFVPGQNGTIFPVENGEWLVTLSGTRGGEPAADDGAFIDFARGLRHPIIADFIAGAEPLTSVSRTRSTYNRRFHFEKVPRWPSGIAVLGDAVAAFNPIFGHGMIASAKGAVALGEALRSASSVALAGAELTRTVAGIVSEPWQIATSQDVCYPDCRVASSDPQLAEWASPRQQQLTELVGEIATRHPVVSTALLKVTSLADSAACMQAPEVITAVQEGPTHPRLTAPPLTTSERLLLPG